MNKNELTNDQITDIWEAMPGQPEGWLKQFGYIQFARAIEAEVASRLASKVGNASLEGLTSYEPSDDGMFRNNVSGEYVVFADVKRLLANAGAGGPVLTKAAFEQIAESWDGCGYDWIDDIGAALRRDFERLASVPPLTAPAPLTDKTTVPEGWEPVYLVWNNNINSWVDVGRAEYEAAEPEDCRIAYQPKED